MSARTGPTSTGTATNTLEDDTDGSLEDGSEGRDHDTGPTTADSDGCDDWEYIDDYVFTPSTSAVAVGG